MAVTEKNITSTGATSYTFEFEYLKTTDVKVSVNGTVTTEFQVPNGAPTTVQFNSGHVPASGAAIRIYRDSNVDNLYATFYAGSAIKSQDLNDNFNQNLYVTQEAKRDAASAWQDGDETINSTETWQSDNTKIATTGAIDSRVDAKIDTALTTDVVGGDRITVTDNSPSSGKITIKVTPDSIVNADVNSSAAIAQSKLNIADATASASGYMSGADKTKLTGIETAATADQTAAEIRTLVEAATDSNVFTDADHSKLNAIEASATADQTDAEIRTAVEAASDSNVFTDADHTKLNAIEASATADQTASEIKTLYESNAQTNPLTDAEKQVIDGVTSNTSELNKLDGYTGSTNDLNIVSGKSFKTSSGTLDTTSDTEIPSSKAIAAHVASSQTAIGGFITIADEVAFPNTQPATGVVISINNAAGVVVNGSGVSTTGRRVDSTVVTINGFPSSLNDETLAAGVGLVVTSTSTANTYAYHKLLAAETDVKQLSDDINDFNARYRVASSAPGSSNDAGDMYFDTSANKMKVYNGTTNAWDDVASVGSFYVNTISSSSGTGGGSATFNGSAYRFTLSNAGTSAQQHIVSVNGVIQKPNSGTSQPSEGFAISGNDIIFSAAPASGSDSFIITCGSSVSIGTPSANSVNSSHIIDGSIVDGDISNSANIAGSKVADDSIPEVKLDVHNAPATDKYLKYTSNGMEWSDGASEGTDVKSTGESGTTKFLRTDGDGTSSWQVVPSDSSKANLSGASFTGDVSLGDNDILRIGTGSDLQIYHSGSSSWIYDAVSTTGPLTIGSNENDIYIKGGTSAAETMAAFKSNGSCELFENNVKRLETTTDGINVTGQINVNGSALSAAPEVTLTASEAITAEDAIMVKTNGQAEKIAGANSGLHAESTLASTGNQLKQFDICYDQNSNKYVALVGYGYQGSIRCQVGTPSSNGETVTWGTMVEFTAIGYPDWDDRKASINMVYDPSQQKVYFCYRDKENSGKIRHGWISITNTTPSLYRQQLMHSYDNVDCVTCAAGKATNNTDQILVTYRRNSDARVARVYDSGSLAELSNEDYINTEPVCTSICSGNGGYLVTWSDNNNSHKPRGVFLTCGASSVPSLNSPYYFQESAADYMNSYTGPKTAYDPNSNRFVVVWSAENSGKLIAAICQIDSSWSGQIASHTTIDTDVLPPVHQSFDVDFDADSGKIVFAWSDADDARLRTAKIVNDAFVFDTEVDVQDRTLEGFRITIDTLKNKIGTLTGSANGSVRSFKAYTPPATNLDANRFIGFAKASVSSGAEVVVKVNSNTSTRSGLSAGTNYFVADTGGLSTSASNAGTIKAGIALSSTKLLIKG